MELENFESRMVHDGKRNNREVKVYCKRCGKDTWQRWQRVKKKTQDDSDFFCSKECFDEYQRKESRELWGYENARFYWDKSGDRWVARWYDGTGNMCVTTKANWLWNTYKGGVPDNWVVTYIDGNPENCELDNLKIISRSESNSIHMQGHYVSDETRKKISIAHTGASKWSGFVKSNEYPGLSKRRKQEVKERDGYTCQICERDLYYSQKCRVHHINGNKEDQDYTNLILVCSICHGAIHSRKDTSTEILAFRSMLD